MEMDMKGDIKITDEKDAPIKRYVTYSNSVLVTAHSTYTGYE